MVRVDVPVIIFLFALFVVLQPGVFLTLPKNSIQYCTDIGVDDCPFSESQKVNCKKCASQWTSNFTNGIAPILHTVLYFVIAYFFIGFFPSWFARITNGTVL